MREKIKRKENLRHKNRESNTEKKQMKSLPRALQVEIPELWYSEGDTTCRQQCQNAAGFTPNTDKLKLSPKISVVSFLKLRQKSWLNYLCLMLMRFLSMPCWWPRNTHFIQQKIIFIHQSNRGRKLEPPTALTTSVIYSVPGLYIVLSVTLTIVSLVAQNSFMIFLTDVPRQSTCKLKKDKDRLWPRDSGLFSSESHHLNNGILQFL